MAPEDNPRDDEEPTREEYYLAEAESLARRFRDYTMIQFNMLTMAALQYGIAVTFNQYLPDPDETLLQKEPDAPASPA